MKSRELTEFILDYTNKTKTNYAIMMNGEWGIGKSYYIKNDLFEALKKDNKKCIVISLYRLQKTSEISGIIILEKMFMNKKKLKNVISVGGNITTTLIKSYAENQGIKLNADGKGLDKLKKLVNLSNTLIILEDVERTMIPIEELFGYINNMVEQDHVKVLLVCNENEIISRYENKTDNNSLNIDNEYKCFKEKTIGDTVRFESEIDEAIKNIMKSHFAEEYSFFLEDEEIEKILNIMHSQNDYNLRSFIFACQKIFDIFEKTKIKDNKDKNTKYIMKNIFYSVLGFCMRLRRGENIEWYGTNLYSLTLGCEKYPLFKFCYQYVLAIKHDIDEIDIKEMKDTLVQFKLYEDEKNKDEDVNILRNWSRETEENLRKAIKNIEEKLQNPDKVNSIPYAEYGDIAAYTIALENVLYEDCTNLKELLVKNLYGKRDKVNSNSLFRIYFGDEEDEAKKKYKELQEKMIESLEGISVVDDFQYTVDEVDILCEKIRKRLSAIAKEGKFLTNFDLGKMVQLFLQCEPKEMENIREAFKEVYDYIGKVDISPLEIDRITEFRDLLEENAKKTELDKIQNKQCEWFIINLNTYIDRFNE